MKPHPEVRLRNTLLWQTITRLQSWTLLEIVGITLVVLISKKATRSRGVIDHDERPTVFSLLDVAKEAHQICNVEARGI